MRSSEVGESRSRAWLESDGTWAIALFLACLALYWPTLAPSVVGDDSAEFQMLAPLLGVAHPTGYPLFLLLGWVAAHLPLGGDVAFRLNLLSMFLASAAVAVFYLLLRELEVRRWVAAATALLLASIPGLWLTATAAEVYPLAVLLMALGSWLLLRWGKGKCPLWAAALVFGLALTHHVSVRLMAPAVLFYLLAVDRRLPLRPRQWLPAAAAVLLPLALYLYVPLRAAHFQSMPQLQGQIAGVPKVVASGYVSPWYAISGPKEYFLATRYSGGVLGGFQLSSSVLAQYLKVAQQQYPVYVVLPLALLGLVVMLIRRTRAGLYFLLAYGMTAWAVLRFMSYLGTGATQLLPLHVITIVWFGVGVSWVLERLERQWQLNRLTQGLLILLVACVPAANIVRQVPLALAQQRMDVRSEALALLSQPLPQGAVIAGPWSNITPLRYLQRIEGVRPDLWTVHATDQGIWESVWPDALADGTPLYVLRATEAGPRLLPLPPLVGVSISHPANLSLGQVVSFRGYDLPNGPIAPGQVLVLTLYWQPKATLNRDWNVFIHVLDAQGNGVAQVDRTPLAGLYPLAHWQVGELLADQYEIPLPVVLAPGRYTLVIGWYDGLDRLDWENGESAYRMAEIEVQP